MGVTDKTLEQIQNYLATRTHTVVTNAKTSEIVSGVLAVPKGTVLGSFLFLVYINDLPTQVKWQIRLFADDALHIEL